MRTIPVYSDYKVTMECVRVEIDRDHYIEFIPRQRIITITENGVEKEVYDNYVEIKIVDETVSDFLSFEAKSFDLGQHVKVVQDLIRQVDKMPTEITDNTNGNSSSNFTIGNGGGSCTNR